jgi:hypothetical protein
VLIFVSTPATCCFSSLPGLKRTTLRGGPVTQLHDEVALGHSVHFRLGVLKVENGASGRNPAIDTVPVTAISDRDTIKFMFIPREKSYGSIAKTSCDVRKCIFATRASASRPCFCMNSKAAALTIGETPLPK